MAFGFYSGGSVGAADGTLISSGNKITLTALSPTYSTIYMRTASDYYSSNLVVTIPQYVEMSFDGGTSWKGQADSPYSYTSDVTDLNAAVRVRQTGAAGASTTTISTSATETACTPAPSVSSLTVTPGNTQNVLTWSDVANDSGYLIEQSANGSSGWTTVTTTAAGASSYTHTSLTNGVAVYYRITTVGTGRYSNATTPATGNGTPNLGFTEWANNVAYAAEDIVLGPDGNIWYTLPGADKVIRRTYAGVETAVTLTGGDAPKGICSDGTNLWAAIGRGVVKITTATTPVVTTYTAGFDSGDNIQQVCYGPDGNVWGTATSGAYVFKITSGGTVTQYNGGAPATLTGPYGICHDGTNIWFTEYNAEKISKCTTGGTITRYALTAGATPYGVAYASSKLWVCSAGLKKMTEVNTSGSIVSETAVTSGTGFTPAGVCLGADGNLWWSDYGGNGLIKLTTGLAQTLYAIPTATVGPNGIAPGTGNQILYAGGGGGTRKSGFYNF